jgi:alpha-L-fucosidase
MKKKRISCLIYLLIITGFQLRAQEIKTINTNFLEESQKVKAERLQWWNEARFGMFIHWGLYASLGGEYKGQQAKKLGEWVQSEFNIPREEYALLANNFNPVKFNADEWVKIAKDAGMKYMVITAKHHEGFAMWDSKVSNFDIVEATPFKRDIISELNEACKKQDIKFCLYYSIIDWHHPSQFPDYEGADSYKHAWLNTAIHPEQKSDYIAYMKAQLMELIITYDPGIMWFDGFGMDWWTEKDGIDLYNYCRTLKPDIIINNRTGRRRSPVKGSVNIGDYGTPEQKIPDTGLPGTFWESCMTINDTWGYKYFDQEWKSADDLLYNLIDLNSKGGNYLLNVGPTGEGVIPEPSVERLNEIGNWLEKYGASIYESKASPLEKPEWGRYSRKPGLLFAHILEWPKDDRIVIPVSIEEIKRTYELSDLKKKNLKIESLDNQVVIFLPKHAIDEIAPVIVIEQK